MIGAGPYDRRQVCVRPADDPPPIAHAAGGSAIALRDALAAIDGSGTVIVTDGLTSTAVAAVGSPPRRSCDVTVRAADERRAVVRLCPPSTGDGCSMPAPRRRQPPAGACGSRALLLSGQDIVLRGRFDEVVVSCCTLDPGTAGDLRDPPLIWEPAVDGQPLARDAAVDRRVDVKSLSVERSILGPVRTRLGRRHRSDHDVRQHRAGTARQAAGAGSRPTRCSTPTGCSGCSRISATRSPYGWRAN